MFYCNTLITHFKWNIFAEITHLCSKCLSECFIYITHPMGTAYRPDNRHIITGCEYLFHECQNTHVRAEIVTCVLDVAYILLVRFGYFFPAFYVGAHKRVDHRIVVFWFDHWIHNMHNFMRACDVWCIVVPCWWIYQTI